MSTRCAIDCATVTAMRKMMTTGVNVTDNRRRGVMTMMMTTMNIEKTTKTTKMKVTT